MAAAHVFPNLRSSPFDASRDCRRIPRFALTARLLRVAALAAGATALACAGAASAPPAGDAAEPLPSLLTLDDAIRVALQHNKRLTVSSLGRDIARANVLAALGTFDPAITFSRSHGENNLPVSLDPLVTQLTKTDDYNLSLDGITPWGLAYSIGATAQNQRGTANAFSDNYATFGGITITQPLLRGFGFGTTLANLRVAKANRGIATWDYRQTVIDTITDVIIAYNNVQQARDTVRIAEVSRGLAAQLLDMNEKMLRIGATSQADVIQARARVANREEDILIAKRAAHDVENQLRVLLGQVQFDVDPAPLILEALPPAPPFSVDEPADLKRAYDLRPDYRAARLGIVIYRANNAAARNALLPRLDFVGSYGYNGLDHDFSTARAQVRERQHRAYSAGFVVRVPLTFAEGRGKARAAKYTLRRSEADLVRLREDIAASVAAAAGQIETTGERVTSTRYALDLAKQALDAEQKRFKAGRSSTFVVLQLQEQLTGVEYSYARALADQRRAIANYQRETGTTVEAHGIALQ